MGSEWVNEEKVPSSEFTPEQIELLQKRYEDSFDRSKWLTLEESRELRKIYRQNRRTSSV
jgi:hypothetical protein